MKNFMIPAGLILALLPAAAFASTPHKIARAAKKDPTLYACSKCHMQYSAADAKKDHYKDPMDGGTLLPVKQTPKPKG